MAVSLGRGKMAYLALSMFVVTPLQLLIWRAIWKFLDVYISQMPDQLNSWLEADTANALIVFGVGFVLRCCMEVSQHELGDVIEMMERYIGHGPVAKTVTLPFTYIYICINIVISLCMWCGSWSLLDRAVAYTTSTTPGHIADTADNPEIHGVIAVACLIFLIFMRASISLVAGPLALSSDNQKNVFGAATLYDSRLTNSSYRFFVKDQLFSIAVHLNVVLCWWSIWRLADNAETRLYGGVKRGENRSETQHYSDLFVGCLLATVAYVVQFPFKTLSARVTHTWVYYIVHYVIVITGTHGSILFWRGAWALYDHLLPTYIFKAPLGDETDYVVSSLLAAFMLIGLGALNTTTCRGVGIRIERHSDDLLFDLEYRHPWRACCITDAANYDHLDEDHNASMTASGESGPPSSTTNNETTSRSTDQERVAVATSNNPVYGTFDHKRSRSKRSKSKRSKRFP